MAHVTVGVRFETLEVRTPHQVQCLREIRNAGRFGYSHDHAEITADQQRAWWQAMQGRIHAWLYAVDGLVIGFGLIRRADDGRWSPSAGVLPGHAGQGYGGRIVDDLADQARARGVTLWAEALLTNPAAVKTHHADRWEHLSDDATYAYFKTKP